MKKYEATISQIGETVEEIENGAGDLLLEYAEMKMLAKIISEALAQIEAQAIDEVKKHGGSLKAQGYQFTFTRGSVMYNYKAIPQWAKKKQELDLIEELAKQAAKISVLSTPGKVIVDENGEVVKPAETNYKKSSLSVKALKP